MTKLSEGIKGQTKSIRRKTIKTAPAGRVCDWQGEPECDTRLTIYNRKSTCFLHTPKRVPRLRGRTSDTAMALGLGVDTSVRCYMCAVSLSEFDDEAAEIQSSDGEWHWWVKGADKLVKVCKVQ